MKTFVQQTVVITLELTAKEALWLRAVMQNPLHEGENKDDRVMREALFNAIPNNLINLIN